MAAGASAARVSTGGDVAGTPAAVARSRGFGALAAALASLEARSGSELWAPSPDPALAPSSSLWGEARSRHAGPRGLRVGYGGGVATVRPGDAYYVDSWGRVLVGWHGTVSPPCGMDGDPMLSPESVPVDAP